MLKRDGWPVLVRARRGRGWPPDGVVSVNLVRTERNHHGVSLNLVPERGLRGHPIRGQGFTGHGRIARTLHMLALADPGKPRCAGGLLSLTAAKAPLLQGREDEEIQRS